MSKRCKWFIWPGGKQRLSPALVFCLLCGWGMGCTEPPPPTLVHRDRMLIDSLFRDFVQQRKPQLDSICKALWEERVSRARDSIVEVRLAEIRERKRQLEARLRLMGAQTEKKVPR